LDELALLELTPAQLRVFLAMSHLESRQGEVRASMDELGDLTGYSRSSVHRAVESLRELGWIEVTRTKRNFGLLSENRYRLLRCSKADTSRRKMLAEGSVVDDTPTQVVNTTKSIKITKSTSKLNNTRQEGSVVNRWSDDDEVGGFGLLDGETPGGASPAAKAKKHRSEKDSSTWTAQEMASEVASRIYAKVRGIPGVVNTKRLAIALATNRKHFGVTAAQEFAAMEKFFGDERNMVAIKRMPKNSHGIFLNAVTKYVAEHGEQVKVVDEAPQVVYIYASDGKEFDNSMGGRLARDEYEQKLKG
jgi:biotin operon repressor